MIRKLSKPTDAVAAVFDLAGFTNFCHQIDPHLSVPHYLNEFLTWLMKQLREETRHSEKKEKRIDPALVPNAIFCEVSGGWSSGVVEFRGDG